MKYLGTHLIDGKPFDSSACANNIENAGFVIASAASGQSFWLIEGYSNGIPAPFSRRSMNTNRTPIHRSSLSKRAMSLHPILSRRWIHYSKPSNNSASTFRAQHTPHGRIPSTSLQRRTLAQERTSPSLTPPRPDKA